MIIPKIKLYILLFNKITLSHDIVSISDSSLVIPTIDITEIKQDIKIEDILSRLFESYVDLSAKFINYKLFDVNFYKSDLIISYMCFVPFGTNIKNAVLLSTKNNEYFTQNLQNIIQLL